MVLPKMRKVRCQDFTEQSVLPLMKKPASSRSPTKSHTSLFVTQWSAVTAPLWPLRTRILLWTFFCPAEDKSCLWGVPLSLVAERKGTNKQHKLFDCTANINPQNLDKSYLRGTHHQKTNGRYDPTSLQMYPCWTCSEPSFFQQQKPQQVADSDQIHLWDAEMAMHGQIWIAT